jgi:anti-sigma-K factor RskA
VTHTDYKEMLAAYALGALDAEEARLLEEHLATCADCRAEVAEWRDTTAALALSAETAEPSAGLRARILESVRAIPQNLGVGETSGDGVVAAAEDGNEGVRNVASNVIQMPLDARRRWSASLRFGALAASVAIIALAASLFVLWNRYHNLQRQYEREHTAVDVLAKQLADEREMRELLTAPGVRLTELNGLGPGQSASARMALDPQTGRAMLFAYNLPPAPAGKAYQLWFISDLKHPVPGAVFNPDAQGRVVLRDQAPEAGRKASVFAVTLEPSGGVAAPTGDKYLLSPLS